MDLAARVSELERLGFTILEQTDDHIDAIRCRWHLDLMLTQVTVAVRVRKQDHVDEALLRADRQDLSELLDVNDPSRLPRGFQKGRATVAAYLCEQSTDGAHSTAEQAPSLQFASFHIAGIRDGSGVHTYTGTRLWGAIYYPLLKFLVGAMLEPKGEPEPISWSGIGVGILFVLLMALSFSILFS